MDLVEVCQGTWGSVAFAVLANRSCLAAEFINDLEKGDKAKLKALFQRFADYGPISNREKFRKIADNLYEFKSFQIRVFCFIKGRQGIVTHCVRKKRDDLNPADIERAIRIRTEYECINLSLTKIGKTGRTQ